MLKKLKEPAKKKGFISIPVSNESEFSQARIRCEIEFEKGHKMVIEGDDLEDNMSLIIKALA